MAKDPVPTAKAVSILFTIIPTATPSAVETRRFRSRKTCVVDLLISLFFGLGWRSA